MMFDNSLLHILLRISLPPAFGLFALGAPAGLAALPCAWMRKFDDARSYSRFSLVFGGFAGLWTAIVTAYFGFVAPWLFVVPSVLSAIALAHSHYYEHAPRLSRYQFAIPTIFYATLVTAVIATAATPWITRETPASMPDDLVANLGRIDSISDVVVQDFRPFGVPRLLPAYDIQFSLAGRPDTLVRMVATEEMRTCDSDEPLSRVDLLQFDRWEFYGELTLEQSRSPKPFVGASVTPEGMCGNRVPFPIRSIDDIVDNYDQLVEVLKTWPTEDQPEERDLSGLHFKYWAVEDEAFATRNRESGD